MNLWRKKMAISGHPERRRAYGMYALILCALVTSVILTNMSPAGYSDAELTAHVKIDGVDYGDFDQVGGLEKYRGIDLERKRGDKAYRKITLTRDFITDPSLYLWAKRMMRSRTDLKDIHIVMENQDGDEVSRYVLKYCQPLSWTVEAANPAVGGFHEAIDLAVQEVAVY